MLLRIGFAIVVGILVTALMKWLLTGVPQIIDVLVGIVAAFIARSNYPTIFNHPPRI